MELKATAVATDKPVGGRKHKRKKLQEKIMQMRKKAWKKFKTIQTISIPGQNREILPSTWPTAILPAFLGCKRKVQMSATKPPISFCCVILFTVPALPAV